jgi:Flp pilus assembly pilin Flp
MKIKRKKITKGETGASAVEFAIILPVLVLLILGGMEFSLLLFNKAMITNASREGARLGVVFQYVDNGDQGESPDDYQHPSDAEIENRIREYLQQRLITFENLPDNPGIDIKRCSDDPLTDPPNSCSDDLDIEDRAAGASLVVTVTHQYDFLVPFLDVFGPVINEAVTVMRFE